MTEPILEDAWNAFCEATVFERFDIVPKVYMSQKTLSLEIKWNRIDSILVHPAHSLEEFGLKVLSDLREHDIKADEAVIYIGSNSNNPVDEIGNKGG